MLSHNPRPRIIQNYIVIWLDSKINEFDADYQNSISQLRCIVSSVQTFVDIDQCIDYLTDIKNEKVFMIVSGTLDPQLILLIQDISQLNTMYVFCTQEMIYQQWVKDYPKVKGIFTHIEPLCKILKQNVHQTDKNMTPMSIVSPSSVIDLNQLNPSFMYSQLLKEILLKMRYDDKAKTEFIEFCILQQFENESAIRVIDEFERDYHRPSPIWWYTRDCFIYSMLNKALRTQDIDVIMKMGFFIHDLHHQIQDLYSISNNRRLLIVYRGQGIQHAEFEKMKGSKGGLLSFNSFLSTSTDRPVALARAESAGDDPELTGILFHMEINPSISTTPFASLDHVSYYSDSESEILFSMHTIFRIGEINPLGKRLWEVKLILTNDDDEQLKRLTQHIRKQIEGENQWSQLIFLMLIMGEYDKAEEFFNIMSESMPDDNFVNAIIRHSTIGNIKARKGDHYNALLHHKKALELQMGFLPNHPNVPIFHNNVGSAYQSIGKYSDALVHFEMALKIHKIFFPLNNDSLALSHHNIAVVHRVIGNYSDALSHFQEALKIHQSHLPPTHSDIATSHNDIGLLYQLMGKYSSARSHFEKALEIYQKCLPSSHPYVATLHNNIGLVYDSMREYSNALSHFSKALEMRQKSLPYNHSELACSHHNVGFVYTSKGENSIALSHYQKALEISQQSLPPNHPDLGMVYSNIGTLYHLMEDPSLALLHYQKALKIFQQSLPSNHIDLALTHTNIGSVYRTMRDLPSALSHYEKALKIYQQSLLPNHPDLISLHSNMAVVYQDLCCYEKAIQHLSKAIDIGIHVFGHDDLQVQILLHYLEQLRRMR